METRQTRLDRHASEKAPAQQSAPAVSSSVARTLPNQNVQTIDLLDLFFRMVNSWKSFLLAMLLGASILGAYHTFFVQPSYQATTELYITSTDSLISLSDLQIGSALTEDYQSIIKSRIVLNQVIEALHLDTDYRKLGKLISVSNPTGTHIIRTTVTTSDMELSRDVANAMMNFSIERIYQIVGANEPTVIEYSEAQAVENVMPSFTRYAGIGALLGVLFVAALVTIQMMMDTTIKNDEDVSQSLQMAVLAAVPYFEE